MAAKPTITLKWAATLTNETILWNGNNILRPNRSIINSSFENTGVLHGQPLPRQYVNQFNYLTAEWINHLNERYSVGDVIFTVSSENATTISTRLGGTWVQRGTQNIGTITGAKVWEKTA